MRGGVAESERAASSRVTSDLLAPAARAVCAECGLRQRVVVRRIRGSGLSEPP